MRFAAGLNDDTYIGPGSMSFSNLALIVYLVVLSFLIKEIMFSCFLLAQPKTLKLFRWRNTFKSEKFIVLTKN